MATHLTTANNIKNFAGFPIAKQIDDAKIETCINEAEQIHVKPRITDALYLDLLKWEESTNNKDFLPIYKTLMCGGQWQSSSCNRPQTRQFDGLINAVNYYAYARIIKRADDNVTRFGFVQKVDEHSRSNIELKREAYNDALHTADIFMNDVVLFLNDNKKDIPLFNRAGQAKNRFSITVLK